MPVGRHGQRRGRAVHAGGADQPVRNARIEPVEQDRSGGAVIREVRRQRRQDRDERAEQIQVRRRIDFQDRVAGGVASIDATQLRHAVDGLATIGEPKVLAALNPKALTFMPFVSFNAGPGLNGVVAPEAAV